MTELKERLKQLFHSLKKVNWLDMIKTNKHFVIIICSVTIVFLVMSVFVSAVRPSIREKQLHAISELKSNNKQVKPIQETDISSVFSDKEPHIVAVIDTKQNPSLNQVETLLDKHEPLETVNWKIDYIQPIYNFSDIETKYKLTAKNTFIVMENGKEKGRYSFNDLKGGLQTLDEKLIAIIQPSIARKEPKRIKVAKKIDETLSSSSSSDKKKKKTKEIIFE